MNNLKTLLIILLLSTKTLAQDDPLKNYYVVDSIVYKNKVKFKLDTLSNPPKQNTITEYDTLGREILFYYLDSKFKYKSVYKNSADTILRFLSIVSGENQEERIIEIQKYLYNNLGKIILKSDCYINSNNISAQLTKFYYDSFNRMTAKHYYYAHNFSKILHENYSTNESSYELNTVENYFYDTLGMLILIKEMSGPVDERFTDTLKYDNNGKLTAIIKFQKIWKFERMRIKDLLSETRYLYTDSSWLNYEPSSFSRHEYVISITGLLLKEYVINDNRRELYRRWDYTYFDQ